MYLNHIQQSGSDQTEGDGHRLNALPEFWFNGQEPQKEVPASAVEFRVNVRIVLEQHVDQRWQFH